MVQKYFIVIDEREQTDEIDAISKSLRRDGMELVFQYIDPTQYQVRDNHNQPVINREALKKAINDIAFFRQAEVIACDYNLAPDLDGFEVITMIREAGYSIKKQIILYSAHIDDVITKIIEKIQQNPEGIEEQKKNLALLTTINIEFIRSDAYKDRVIGKIRNEPVFDLVVELIQWLYKFKDEKFISFFPPYDGKAMGEIAGEIEQATPNSQKFQKEIIEYLLSNLMNLNGLK